MVCNYKMTSPGRQDGMYHIKLEIKMRLELRVEKLYHVPYYWITAWENIIDIITDCKPWAVARVNFITIIIEKVLINILEKSDILTVAVCLNKVFPSGSGKFYLRCRLCV